MTANLSPRREDLQGVMTPASLDVMTPDRYNELLARVTEIVDTLRKLDIPPEVVHSVDVQFWSGETSQVSIHVSGESDARRALVDRIGDHYGLPADDGSEGNYYRGVHLGKTSVLAYCGRPPS